MLGFEAYALIFCFVNLLFASVWAANTQDDELRTRRGDVVALLLVAVAILCVRLWASAPMASPAPKASVYHAVFATDTGRLEYVISPELAATGYR